MTRCTLEIVFFFLAKIMRLQSQKVINVAAGSQHSLALTEAGEVFSWGDNSYGQLGRGQLDESQTRQPKYALVF